MTSPGPVPAPLSLDARAAAPLRLAGGVAIDGPADAAAALERLIAARTGLPVALDGAPASARIALTVTDDGAPESYRLAVDEHGATIAGADAAGLFYGIQTLAQLIGRDDDAWTVPAVRVEDAPRFAYRGVMLDVARHFHPVETVKAYIDRAAGLKFNHFHLHLSDDQGWRLEIASRPELTARASGSSIGGDPGGRYTQDDYRELVAYAAARHLTVVPEIDLPGHTHAVSLAYPELSEEPVLSDEVRRVVSEFGGDLPRNGAPYDGLAVGFSSLRIHDEATYAFVADVLAEVAALTPGPYLHVGGDEALGTPPEDFAYFVERVTRIAADTGKTPVTWHEAGAIGDRLAAGTIGQYWGYRTPAGGMDDKARAFVDHGGRVILSPADAVYLDMAYAADAPFGLRWAGVVDARQAYEWEPAEVVDGIGEAGILGVEAPLWTETVRDLATIDALAFPRIAAAAEAAWSPALGTTPQRSWASFRERVGRLAPLWTALGIGYTPLDDFPWAVEQPTTDRSLT